MKNPRVRLISLISLLILNIILIISFVSWKGVPITWSEFFLSPLLANVLLMFSFVISIRQAYKNMQTHKHDDKI